MSNRKPLSVRTIVAIVVTTTMYVGIFLIALLKAQNWAPASIIVKKVALNAQSPTNNSLTLSVTPKSTSSSLSSINTLMHGPTSSTSSSTAVTVTPKSSSILIQSIGGSLKSALVFSKFVLIHLKSLPIVVGRAFMQLFRMLFNSNILFQSYYSTTDHGYSDDNHPNQPILAKSSSPHANDHISLSNVALTSIQQSLIDQIKSTPEYSNKTLQEIGLATDFPIDEHIIYRYFAAADWSTRYNGKLVNEAMRDTAEWRYTFGIHKIDISELRPLMLAGLSYVSPIPDKHGRTVVYIHIGRNVPIDKNVFLKFLMYTVESHHVRADRQSVQTNSGRFVAIIDMANFTWANCPDMGMIKQAMALLKYHYPHRFAGNYIINTNGIFQFVWNMLKPLVPKKVISKTHVLSASDKPKVLDRDIGMSNLDVTVGGTYTHSFSSSDVDMYTSRGYWPKK